MLGARSGYRNGSKATLMRSACQTSLKFAVIDNRFVPGKGRRDPSTGGGVNALMDPKSRQVEDLRDGLGK